MSVSDSQFFDLIQKKDTAAALAALAARPALACAPDTYLGSTPLHFAAHRGLTEVVAALLDAGADVHVREAASGSTALHWAAEGGHVAIVESLLARGASLEARDDWHLLTPLGWATIVDWAPQHRDDRPGTVARLLAAGAILDPFTALALGRIDSLRTMVATDPTAMNVRLGYVAWEMTPLHVAAASNLAEPVRLLLDLGADRGARTTTGLTPFALARQRGHADVGALLDDPGASMDVSAAVAVGDVDGIAACARSTLAVPRDILSRLLFVAVEQQNEAVAAALLLAGADVDVRIHHLAGERSAMLTPLQFAARGGCAKLAHVLVNAGANPSAGRAEGLPTPLHFAAGEGHLETVRVLLAAGADIGARDSVYHATPAGWAEFGGHSEVAMLLLA
jgi:ankyrin repeat protein